MKKIFAVWGMLLLAGGLFAQTNIADTQGIVPGTNVSRIREVKVRSGHPTTNLTVEIQIALKLDRPETIDKVEADLSPVQGGVHPLNYDVNSDEWKGSVILPRGNLKRKLVAIRAYEKDGSEIVTNVRIAPGRVLNTPIVESDGWRWVIDICLLSLFLMIGTFLKRKVHFFRKFLIPNAMIAGFLGLAVRLIMNHFFPNWGQLSLDRLGILIYHLMGIGYVALALKGNEEERNNESVKTGAFIVSYYLIQGILGFAISLILFYTIFPDIFPPFGLLLPLGYGQGPGQAYSIGSKWEALGFQNGGTIGLTIATFGFLWACFGGVPLLNYLVKRKKMVPANADYGKNAHDHKKKSVIEDEPGSVPLSESIDRVTIQSFLIGIAYLLTFATLWGLSSILNRLGTFGQTLSQMLWGFHFILGALYGLLVQKVIGLFKKGKIMSRTYPNRYLLERLAGGAFDFMIAASIVALSWQVFKANWVAILLVTTIGGIVTIWYVVWLSKKVYPRNTLEYILALYGMATGTISTGLVLLKEVDPTFKTPVAQNMVLGSGVALFLGLPLILTLPVPVTGYVEHKPWLYFLTYGLFVLILIGLFLIIFLPMRRKQLEKGKEKGKKKKKK